MAIAETVTKVSAARKVKRRAKRSVRGFENDTAKTLTIYKSTPNTKRSLQMMPKIVIE